jgi:hypothetical protein
MSTCKLEINNLSGEKTIVEDVSVTERCIGDVFDMVVNMEMEPPGQEFKLMAVINGRLVPMRATEQERLLADLGFQGNQQYRIEVCLSWRELKKVLM